MSSPKKKKRVQASGFAHREAKRKRDALPFLEEWTERYKEIGAPPEDTVGRVEWASRLCAMVIYETMAAPALRPPADRKLVLEGVRTLGMTAVKALYESRLKKIETTLYGRRSGKGTSDALDGLEPDPTAGPPRKV